MCNPHSTLTISLYNFSTNWSNSKIHILSNLNIVPFKLFTHFMKFKVNSTSNHPSTITISFSSNLRNPKNPKIIKIESTRPASPGGCSSPPSSSSRSQNLSCTHTSPGGTGHHRQAVHPMNPETLTRGCVTWRLRIARQAVSGIFQKHEK